LCFFDLNEASDNTDGMVKSNTLKVISFIFQISFIWTGFVPYAHTFIKRIPFFKDKRNTRKGQQIVQLLRQYFGRKL
jgi:hypothetical protein